MASSKLNLARARLSRLAKESADAIQTVRATVESSATGAALGYFEAKAAKENKKLEVAGLPASLVVGVAGLGLSMVPAARGAKKDLQAIGQGAFTVYSYEYGKQMAQESKKSGASGRRRSVLTPGGMGAARQAAPQAAPVGA